MGTSTLAGGDAEKSLMAYVEFHGQGHIVGETFDDLEAVSQGWHRLLPEEWCRISAYRLPECFVYGS